MHAFSFCWGIGVGPGTQSKSLEKPEWLDIEPRLESLVDNRGWAELSMQERPAIGPYDLQVFADQGNYLLMLGEDDGTEYNVRSFTNTQASPGRIEILGDYWDARQVCQDFTIVRQAFKQFLETGNVSQDLLN